MAAAGTLVLAEDADQGGVYVRHQLTTGVDGGMLYYEDSVTAVADALSFQFKAIVDSYIGKKNVTSRTVTALKHDLTAVLVAALQSSSTSDVGALINNYSGLVVAQNPLLLDRVSVTVDVEVAVPLNGVDVDINYLPATITIAI
jgi:phage head maturation protease